MTSEEWRELVRPDALGGTLEDILDDLTACEQARDGYAKDAYECLARAEKAEAALAACEREVRRYREEVTVSLNLQLQRAAAELATLKARCEGMRGALKTHLDEANEVIDLLRIGADNETDTTIDCMEAVRLIDAFDAALESALASLPVEGLGGTR